MYAHKAERGSFILSIESGNKQRLVVGKWNPLQTTAPQAVIPEIVADYFNGLLDPHEKRKWNIVYGDPLKKGGHSYEFTGTPEEAEKEVKEAKQSMWEKMNRNGEPYGRAELMEKLNLHERFDPNKVLNLKKSA